jgi:hypothetical protein
MIWIKFRELVLVAISSVVGLSAFLLGDYLVGHHFVAKNLQNEDRPFLKLGHGWYELKRNFMGQDQYGPFIYPVTTDSYGFRKSETEDAQAKYDVIFLGDSFTYGVNGPWHETFVGMFAKRSGARVLNAGVSSYSPTPYLYQYKKALKNGLLNKRHSIVIGIDISDVQDEAAYWDWDEKSELHPKKMVTSFSDQKPSYNSPTLRQKIRDALPMSVTLYRFIRYQLVASRVDPLVADLTEKPRSAFTWESWSKLNKTRPQDNPSGYAPLGVEGGLVKIASRVAQISGEAKKHHSKVYILIYPWPAQLTYVDTFNWSAWVKDLCVSVSCMGVIDTIPHFRKLAGESNSWYEDYYLKGDIHFNEKGNRVLAEHLLEYIPTKSLGH